MEKPDRESGGHQMPPDAAHRSEVNRCKKSSSLSLLSLSLWLLMRQKMGKIDFSIGRERGGAGVCPRRRRRKKPRGCVLERTAPSSANPSEPVFCGISASASAIEPTTNQPPTWLVVSVLQFSKGGQRKEGRTPPTHHCKNRRRGAERQRREEE